MEEKELVKKIKNSFRAQKTDSEIRNKLQEKGYKMAYIDKLIDKSKQTKRIFSILLLSTILLLSLSAFSYTGYTVAMTKTPLNIKNPFGGVNVESNNIHEDSNQNSIITGRITQQQINEIEITPEFISYLLNEIGAWQLHANPLTGENPIINFKIDDKVFSSEITNHDIITVPELNNNADISFNSNKEDVVKAMLSNNPAMIFNSSYNNGKSYATIEKSEAELFAKGYLKFYNSFNI